MHQYLRAIGFSNPIARKELYNFIQGGVEKPVYRAYTTIGTQKDALLAQYDIPVGSGIGISVFGQFDEEDIFYPEYYYPYLDSNRISSTEEVEVEQKIDNNSYDGICDDLRLGLTLVFRLRNAIEYLQQSAMIGETVQPGAGETGGDMNRRGPGTQRSTGSVSLSGLSLEGTILLPIYKSDSDRRQIRKNSARRRQLMNAARDGDDDAMLDLTAEEMDTYSNILTHLQYDDVYSIVDSFFMPHGSECELYSVLGEIVDFTIRRNDQTGEDVVVLTLDCNGLQFNTAINRKDLYGEPAAGRRFKGIVWLMGKINFPSAGT